MHDVYENPALSDSARFNSSEVNRHFFFVIEIRVSFVYVEVPLITFADLPDRNRNQSIGALLNGQVPLIMFRLRICTLLS